MDRSSTAWRWLQRRSRGIAIVVWVLTVLLLIAALTFNTLMLLDIAPGGRLSPVDLFWEPGFFVLAMLGALIFYREPDQVMGWIFCLIGLLTMISWPALAYEQFAGDERLPLLTPTLVLAQMVDLNAFLILFVIVPYLFPGGRLLSQRWKPVLIIAIITVIVFTLTGVIGARQIGVDDRQQTANPLHIQAVDDIADTVDPLSFIILSIAMVGGIVGMTLRYRRSRGIERLQIRWVLWALSLVIALVIAFLIGQNLTPSLIDTSDDNWTTLELVLGLSILISAGIGVPVILGLSILRYRLYSIELILQRTLVYGALTFGLGAAYWGGVVLLQRLLDPLISGSSLAVAGSTLAVATVFQPFRRGIQRVVDRRFFRQKYDAAATVETFSARLRDAVDLDTLRSDLRHVLTDTVQPAHVSIWLRPAPRAPNAGTFAVRSADRNDSVTQSR